MVKVRKDKERRAVGTAAAMRAREVAGAGIAVEETEEMFGTEL